MTGGTVPQPNNEWNLKPGIGYFNPCRTGDLHRFGQEKQKINFESGLIWSKLLGDEVPLVTEDGQIWFILRSPADIIPCLFNDSILVTD